MRRKLTAEEYQMMSPDSRLMQYQSVRAQMKTYYAASWHGTASAVLAYSLVQELNRASNLMLWYAISGLTDQLVHERIEHEHYVREAQLLQAEATPTPTPAASTPASPAPRPRPWPRLRSVSLRHPSSPLRQVSSLNEVGEAEAAEVRPRAPSPLAPQPAPKLEQSWEELGQNSRHLGRQVRGRTA